MKQQEIALTERDDLTDFPGYFAGASLKRSARRGDRPAGGDFPGYFAGASLKPGHRSAA